MMGLRRIALLLGLGLAVAVGGCGGSSGDSSAADADEPTPVQSVAEAEQRTKPEIEVPDGPAPEELVVEDLIRGSGKAAKKGDEIAVEYRALWYKNGKELANSWDEEGHYPLELGPSDAIAGWEVGLPGMRVGGRRKLIIPPYLLDPGGVPPDGPSSSPFPPEEGLVYVVDLYGVSQP